MATTRKVLGQATVTPEEVTTIYTVPAGTETVISSVTMCNIGDTSDTVYMFVAIDGEATAYKQAVYWHMHLVSKETFAATLGITLSAGDQIAVRSNTGNTSFNLFGMEIS